MGALNKVKLMLAVLVCASSIMAKNTFTWRTVLWPSCNFASKDHVNEGKKMLARMQKAGYNGLFLGGAKLKYFYKNPTFASNARNLAASAKGMGIEIIPCSQFQKGNFFMPQDLREALPAIGTPFVVQNGVARAKGDPAVSLVNGDIEQPLAGTWKQMGAFFKLDTQVKRFGNSSVRCDVPAQKGVHMSQNIQVKPHRTYVLSGWVKSQNVKVADSRWASTNPMCGTFFTVLGGGQYLLQNREYNGIKANADWRSFEMRFNSAEHSNVKICVNASYYVKITGTIWFDDLSIEEVGLKETIRRTNMPVVVRTTTGQILAEGKDYVVGKELLTIPVGSQAKNGDELRVDWFTQANMFYAQSEAAFCYNEVYEGMRQEILEEDKVFGVSPAKLMTYDEWRMAGWDPACGQMYNIANLGSGKYMAAVANTTADLYREANGSRVAIAWNDMYDPYHNSRLAYKMVNGGNLGSGHYLYQSTVILNWNGGNRKQSLLYFGGLDPKSHGVHGVKRTKQRQIISCSVGSWNNWLSQLSAAEQQGNLPDGSVIGMNYHTFAVFPQSYAQIETMANACKADGRWENGPIPLPAGTAGKPWGGLPGVGIDTDKSAGSDRAIGISQASLKGTGSLRTLSFAVPATNMVRISVVNLQGQKVSTILNEKMAKGSYERKIDLSKMAPGVYFARLELDGASVRSTAKKMVVFCNK